MSGFLIPLDQVANEINVRLDRAAKADDHRIAAGHLLREARERIQTGKEGPITWTDWVASNIQRSMRDVQRCIALVEPGGDPEERRETEKTTNREAKPKGSRATGASRVSPSTSVEPQADQPDPLGVTIIQIKTLARDDLEDLAK